MKTQIIEYEFNPHDALEIIDQLAQVKIKGLERCITKECNIEDIKTIEVKIKRLQKDVSESRQTMRQMSANATIEILLKTENI